MTTTKTAYVIAPLRLADLLADGWDEAAAWDALQLNGVTNPDTTVRYFVHRRDDWALDSQGPNGTRDGVFAKWLAGRGYDVGGGTHLHMTEAEAVAAVADEDARIAESA